MNAMKDPSPALRPARCARLSSRRSKPPKVAGETANGIRRLMPSGLRSSGSIATGGRRRSGPEAFEEWLLSYPQTCKARELAGPPSPWRERCSRNGAWRMHRASSGCGSSAERRRMMPLMELPSNGRPRPPSSSPEAEARGWEHPKRCCPSTMNPDRSRCRRVAASVRRRVVVVAPGQDLPPMPVRLVRDDVAYQGLSAESSTGSQPPKRTPPL